MFGTKGNVFLFVLISGTFFLTANLIACSGRVSSVDPVDGNFAYSGYSGSEKSTLAFHPGGGITARPQIRVAGMDYFSDIKPNNAYEHAFQMMMGSDSARAQFRNDFTPYTIATESTPPHPDCPEVANSNFSVYSYLKPYVYNQGEFLGWLHKYAGLTDFVPPAARKMNSYMGNQKCPLGVTDSNLALSFGYQVDADMDQLTLSIDNRLNPWRWNAPVPSVHHVEQPSFSVLFDAESEETTDITLDVLKSYRQGVDKGHLYLSYDIDLNIEDARNEMSENILWDVFDGVLPSASNTLFGWAATLANQYGQLNGEYNYFLKRYVEATVQLSLMVFFRYDGQVFTESEFMLASFNYKTTNPAATKNADINPYILEGGTNPASSWYRLRVDALKLPKLTENYSQNPMVLEGGDYFAIPDGPSQVKLRGKIDLTNYYLVSHAEGFFPGQMGQFNEKYGEKNAIYYGGVVFENHGPFAVKTKINQFDIKMGPPTPQQMVSTND